MSAIGVEITGVSTISFTTNKGEFVCPVIEIDTVFDNLYGEIMGINTYPDLIGPFSGSVFAYDGVVTEFTYSNNKGFSLSVEKTNDTTITMTRTDVDGSPHTNTFDIPTDGSTYCGASYGGWAIIKDPTGKLFSNWFFIGSGSTTYMGITANSTDSFGSYIRESIDIVADMGISLENVINTMGAFGLSVEGTDPYEPGGYSGAGWGTGNFDATSDIIGMPDLPTVSAIDTGFLTLFTPSIAQLQSFQEYLWSDLLEGIKDGSLTDIVDSLKKIVSDPYQAIMGLSIVPVAVPTAGSKDVKMYGVLDSGVVMPYASTQWIEVNCGSLNVNEFWGNYMDYAPYTKITSLYLPFVGVVSVDVDEIMKKTVTIKYRVDILSGQCIAFIIINGSVEYQYQGHCATSLPITASDFSSTINAGLNLISHVTAGVAGIAGGAISGALTGGIGGAIGAVGAAASAANNIASDVMNAKPNIKAGSSVGGAGGLLSVKKPYFIAIRPKQCVASYQKSFTGFPINETYAIRQLTGYTEFERINLDGIPLTQPEKEELESLLMGGVYL